MNSWWLKLYTIPQLKKLTLEFFIANVLMSGGFYYAPEKWGMFLIILGWPALSFVSSINRGIYSNFDFHKMSVPLKELRKAIYLDALIQLAAFVLMMFMSSLIPMFIFVPEKFWALNPFFFLVGSPAFTLLSYTTILVFLYSMKASMPVNWKKIVQSEEAKKRKKYIITVAMVCFAIILFTDDSSQPVSNQQGDPGWLKYILQYNPVFILSVFFLGSGLAGGYLPSLTNFNIIRPRNWKKRALVHVTCLSVAMAFAVVCGYISKIDYNSDTKRITKYKSMILFSDFMPELEVETVRVMLPKSGIFTRAILRRASPEFYEMPIEEFVKDKDLNVIGTYLQVGKPSERNLVYLMKEFETHPNAKDWQSPELYKGVKHLLVYRWPEAKTLPDQLIAEKIVTKNKAMREVASDKKTGP